MKSKKNKLNKFLIWSPVVLLFCVLPFVTYYALYETRLSDFAWTPENKLATDFYLYYKQIFFFCISAFTLLVLCYLLYANKKNKTLFQNNLSWKMLLPLGIYLLLTLVSSLFSKYKWISFTGSDGQFESFFAIAGYILFFLYMLLTICTEEDLQTVLRIVCVFFGISALLGLLQFTGNNPLHWEWFQRLITPEGYLESGATITSVFENNRVSLFSYNPNYAGVLLALSAAGCFGVLVTEKKLRNFVIESLLLIALVISLVGTSSKAGLLTFVAVAAVSLIFVGRKNEKFKYILGALAGAAILGCVLLFTVGSNLPLVQQVKGLLTSEKIQANPIQKMETTKEGVNFIYRDVSFSVAFDYTEGSFDFEVLENGTNAIPLVLSENREVYYLDHSSLSDVTIRPGLINRVLPLFTITLNGREWMFIKAVDEENIYYYLNQYLKLEELHDVERIGFQGRESFATYRGLIWSMTFPVMKDTILLGTGADTFACYYPQNNYKDLYYYTGDATASTRPHSMYLKIAVESGVIALLALLVFFGWYMIQSLRLYWKTEFTSLSSRIGFACFLAVTVYLICGITNDSMITVAPVFWGILGIGIAANGMQKETVR